MPAHQAACLILPWLCFLVDDRATHAEPSHTVNKFPSLHVNKDNGVQFSGLREAKPQCPGTLYVIPVYDSRRWGWADGEAQPLHSGLAGSAGLPAEPVTIKKTTAQPCLCPHVLLVCSCWG